MSLFPPESLESFEVPSVLVNESSSSNDNEGNIAVNKSDILALGTRCLLRAISVDRKSEVAWTNLVINYRVIIR